ncbi:hypothetical protein ACF8C6_09130 [Pseudomonas sp. zbq_18]|uniref:hypothetical protein n=1 Tax=Pseudomonas sp. zbq_18 TaxID=3367251 RepID=UPI00370C7BC5
MPDMRKPRPTSQPFSQISPDEPGHLRQPMRRVIPRPDPLYVDSQGTTTRALPSQSRALVPAGPVTGTSVVPAAQPQPAPQSTPQPGKADFYGNSRGEMGRGSAPSSGRAVVPSGPVTGTSLVPVNEPARVQPEAGSAQPKAAHEPDYRARAETMGRAKADSAAYEAHRATQDARFEAAKSQPAAPAKTTGRMRTAINGTTGKGLGALAVIPAIAESAADDSTARYAKRFGMDEPTGDGSVGDVAKFAALRGLGFASDLGNSLTMGVAGNLLYRDMQGEQAPNAAVAAPAQQSAQQLSPQQSVDAVQTNDDQEPAAPLVSDAPGNGYVKTGFGQGQQGGEIVARLDANGVPEFSNDQAAQQSAVAGNLPITQPLRRGAAGNTMTLPAGATELARGTNVPTAEQQFAAQGSASNLGNGVGTFSQNAPGTAAEAIARFERANEIRGSIKRPRELGDNGGKLTIVRDSGRTPSRSERLRARYEQRLAETEALKRRGDTEAMNAQTLAERNDLARQELMGQQALNEQTLQKGQIDLNAAQRIEQLYALYDQASAADRPAIAEQLRVLTGKDQPARYAVAAGGQMVDPVTQQLVTQPAVVFNQQTGEVVSRGQGAPETATRPVGTRSTVNGKTAVWDGNQWIPQ